MIERLRAGMAGHPSEGVARLPEAWIEGAGGDVSLIAEAVAGRSFLYEDPASFRAGVREVVRALAAAGNLPAPA